MKPISFQTTSLKETSIPFCITRRLTLSPTFHRITRRRHPPLPKKVSLAPTKSRIITFFCNSSTRCKLRRRQRCFPASVSPRKMAITRTPSATQLYSTTLRWGVGCPSCTKTTAKESAQTRCISKRRQNGYHSRASSKTMCRRRPPPPPSTNHQPHTYHHHKKHQIHCLIPFP